MVPKIDMQIIMVFYAHKTCSKKCQHLHKKLKFIMICGAIFTKYGNHKVLLYFKFLTFHNLNLLKYNVSDIFFENFENLLTIFDISGTVISLPIECMPNTPSTEPMDE